MAKRNYNEIKNKFVRLDRNVPGLLYEPVQESMNSGIGVLIMHSDSDYFNFPAGLDLAKRGYKVLCANVTMRTKPLDEKMLDVKAGVEYLRQLPGIEKVLLLGHSGGATLMSAYQNVAENGVQTFQGPEKIVKLSDIGRLPAADGIIFLDSNWGNGAMTLLSLDPAVLDEKDAMTINPALDAYNPENGYCPQGSEYSREFVARFLKAQGERGNRLIDYALERLHLIDAGRGCFEDDEPFIIPAAEQLAFNNKLFPEDVSLMAHTKKERQLLHEDGSLTTQIVYSQRKPMGGSSVSGRYKMGAFATTIRTYLSSNAVRTTSDFYYDDCSLSGIEWESCYCCTPGNVMGIRVPALVMGMTAGYEYLAAETIYENTASSDKTLVFVEGVNHRICEAFPEQGGNHVKALFDYMGDWIWNKFNR